MASGPPEGMSFLEHLDELRRRLLWSLVSVGVAFAACYPLAPRFFAYLQKPLLDADPGAKLSYIRLTEPFFVHLKVAFLGGLLLAMPFLAWQAWLFIAPGLYRHEKRHALPFILGSSTCFGLGALFAFRVLFPPICRFFLQQGTGYQMTVTLDQYFSLLFWTVIGVALTFELPVALGLSARLGLVTARQLVSNFHIAVVACLVIAAVLTPTPDALTMVFVAGPMIALYGVGIVIARLVAPREPLVKTEREASRGAAE